MSPIFATKNPTTVRQQKLILLWCYTISLRSTDVFCALYNNYIFNSQQFRVSLAKLAATRDPRCSGVDNYNPHKAVFSADSRNYRRRHCLLPDWRPAMDRHRFSSNSVDINSRQDLKQPHHFLSFHKSASQPNKPENKRQNIPRSFS